MKIVIDIPEDFYKEWCDYIIPSNKVIACTHIIIQQGTILPKGHGRLIDADDLIQDIIDDSQLCLFNSESERIVHDKMVDFAVDRITEVFPIIEADTEVENERFNKP